MADSRSAVSLKIPTGACVTLESLGTCRQRYTEESPLPALLDGLHVTFVLLAHVLSLVS